jgi:integrase
MKREPVDKHPGIRRRTWTVDGRTQVRFDADYRGPDGRKHTHSFRKLTAAAAWLRAQRAQADAGDWLDPSRGKKTLGAFYAEEIARARRAGKPVERTLIEWDQLWQQFIAPELGNTQLRRITREAIVRLLDRPAKTSAWRHNDALKVIRRLLVAAVVAGEIRYNPAAGIPMMTIDQDEPWILSADEVDQIVEVLPQRFKAMTLLSAYGMLRWSELIALTLREMDLMRNRVRVQDTLVESGKLLEGRGKTKRSRRWVTLPADLSLVVSKHIANFPPNENALIFTAERGGAIRRPAFGRLVWRPATTRAGLAGFPFRNLRHTGAVLALEAGVNPILVAFRMGHSSTRMIEKHYSRLLEPMDAEIASKISTRYPAGRPESSATVDNH